MKLPTCKPEQFTACIDTREPDPHPWGPFIAPLRFVRGGMATGDLTLVGAEQQVSLERKTLPDLIGCVGRERERFQRELDRLLAFPTRAVIVEASWADLENGGWRGSVTPSQAMGSVIGWISSGIPFILAGDTARAGKIAARILYTVGRRQWEQLRTLAANVTEGGNE